MSERSLEKVIMKIYGKSINVVQRSNLNILNFGIFIIKPHITPFIDFQIKNG